MVSAYAAGESMTALARRFDVNVKTVRRVVKPDAPKSEAATARRPLLPRPDMGKGRDGEMDDHVPRPVAGMVGKGTIGMVEKYPDGTDPMDDLRRQLEEARTRAELESVRMRVELFRGDPEIQAAAKAAILAELNGGHVPQAAITEDMIERVKNLLTANGATIVPADLVQDLRGVIARQERDLERAREKVEKLTEERAELKEKLVKAGAGVTDGPGGMLDRFVSRETQRDIAKGLADALPAILSARQAGMGQQATAVPLPAPFAPPAPAGGVLENLTRIDPAQAAPLFITALREHALPSLAEVFPWVLAAETPAQLATLLGGVPGAEPLIETATTTPMWVSGFLAALRETVDRERKAAATETPAQADQAASAPAPAGESAGQAQTVDDQLALLGTLAPAAAADVLSRIDNPQVGQWVSTIGHAAPDELWPALDRLAAESGDAAAMVSWLRERTQWAEDVAAALRAKSARNGAAPA